MSLRFDETTLANGLKIIGEHNPNAQTFAAGYFVNTGSRDETSEIAGVSHFLEHMMFKGTKRRTADQINREFDELGANNNAYTNEERTVYFGAVVAERGPELLDLLTDMMRPSLRQEDFDIEKNVILEEIAMYEDRPSFKVFELANEAFYAGHPLGNSVLGSVESITDLSREQMQTYFDERYAANNMVLALSGNYDWEALQTQVKADTFTWKSFETTRIHPGFTPKSAQGQKLDTKLKRSHVAFFAPGVSAQSKERYAAFLLANCIGDSSGSRLYWNLIDKGLADSASLYHDTNDGLGNFIGYLSAAPESTETVKDIFIKTLLDVESNGLNADEWSRAQRKLATSLTLRSETPYGRLMGLGPSYLYTEDYMTPAEVINKVFATTLSEAETLLETKPFSKLFAFTLHP